MTTIARDAPLTASDAEDPYFDRCTPIKF